MTALRAVNPEIKEVKRAKILISGEAGCGKSFFSIQLPNVYYIDIERGAQREQYQEMLIKSGGKYVSPEQGVSTFSDVNQEFKSLATEKHTFSSVVLDSISHAYFMEAARAEAKLGSEYGRDKKEANKPSRELLRWIDLMDMNVVLIAHSKVDWSKKDEVRTGYDAYDKTGFALDLWLEIVGRNILVRKTRLKQFPEGYVFPRDYSTFARMFGEDKLGAKSKPIVMATKEQVERITTLFKTLNVSEESIKKMLDKFDVESFEELTTEQIANGISVYEKKLSEISSIKK
jgi:hypothetical protein